MTLKWEYLSLINSWVFEDFGDLIGSDTASKDLSDGQSHGRSLLASPY
jgi:hypothetical protein